ncbi:uncharacterized protein LOC143018561 [Oratosquilla oratoria]|uniref:uncharacterized protein LOC143018561 n=1 Tax=Oratosquilla oratoria TaxID=337810 RepID=UPI003F761951
MTFLGIRRFRTASYHPQANGTCEQLHRTLKSSLTASAQSEDWPQVLPLVLLGIGTSLKEDLYHFSAEFVQGTTLRLPDQLLPTTPDSKPSTIQKFATHLRERMQYLQPAQPRTSPSKAFVNQDLDTCIHVFVRVDSVKKPFQPPYQDSFRVIQIMFTGVADVRAFGLLAHQCSTALHRWKTQT